MCSGSIPYYGVAGLVSGLDSGSVPIPILYLDRHVGLTHIRDPCTVIRGKNWFTRGEIRPYVHPQHLPLFRKDFKFPWQPYYQRFPWRHFFGDGSGSKSDPDEDHIGRMQIPQLW
jgi:hypothetical protein